MTVSSHMMVSCGSLRSTGYIYSEELGSTQIPEIRAACIMIGTAYRVRPSEV